jgi:hypothetical protein
MWNVAIPVWMNLHQFECHLNPSICRVEIKILQRFRKWKRKLRKPQQWYPRWG